MVAFYNKADQDLYNNDNLKYMPQEEYRLGMGTTTGKPNMLDMSGIFSNSGIMSQAPVPLKYIPPEGDGGGGKPPGPAVDNSQFDYETEAYGIDPAYGLTEEEQKALDASIAGPEKMGKLGTLGTIGAFFASPLTTIGYLHRRDKKEQKRLDDAVVAAGIQAGAEIGADKGIGPGGSGSRRGNADISDDARGGFATDDTASFFAKGGRVGYFFGGRVNYKAGGRVSFKNGGLASIL